MIRQIKIENDVVQSVVTSKLQLKGYVENDDLTVVIGSRLVNGEFVAPEVDLDARKDDLIGKVHSKANWAFALLDVKYKFTHKRGVAQQLATEWKSYKIDNTAPTPLIDMYAEQKGRTREEQIAKVERIVGFEISATILVEKLVGTIQDAETHEVLDVIEEQVVALDNIKTIDEFLQMIAGQ